jgi:hypothetical protein
MIYPIPVAPRSCAVDLDGNVYLTEDNDSLMKFDTHGVKQWQKKIDATSLQQRPILLCDKDNNLFVTGSYSHRLKIDNVELTNTGYIDAFAFKLSPDGSIDWHITSDGKGQATLYSIIEKKNNVYITGCISGTMSFGSSTVTDQSMYGDLLLVKLNCDNVNGVKENSIDRLDFVISPNPGSGEFYLSGNSFGDCDIQVHNLAGQLIRSEKINFASNIRYRMGAIPKGVYFITLMNSSQIKTKKLIVE